MSKFTFTLTSAAAIIELPIYIEAAHMETITLPRCQDQAHTDTCNCCDSQSVNLMLVAVAFLRQQAIAAKQ